MGKGRLKTSLIHILLLSESMTSHSRDNLIYGPMTYYDFLYMLAQRKVNPRIGRL